MKLTVLCCTLAALLLVPMASAEERVFTRGDDGALANRSTTEMPTSFDLSAERFSACTNDGRAIYGLEVLGRQGVDLIEGGLEELTGLMAPAAFQLNRKLMTPGRGIELTNPEAVAQGLNRFPTASAKVAGKGVSLGLSVFDGGSCGGSLDSALGGETASCSGSCNCSTCVCSGTYECCSAGCGGCFVVADSSGLCGGAQ